MDICAVDVEFGEVAGQLFRHAFCQSCHQHALIALNAQMNLLEKIVNLTL